MICKKCGKEITDSSDFCAECSKKIKIEEVTGEVTEKVTAVANEAFDEAKQLSREVGQSVKGFAEKGADSYKKFKNMSEEEQHEAVEQAKEKVKTAASDVGKGAKEFAEKGIESYKDFKGMSKEEQQEAVEETKEKARGFIKKEKENYRNFRNLSTRQKLIRIAAPLLAVAVLFGIFGSGGAVKVKRDSHNDCYYFDIKYNDFCKEIAPAISDVSGVSESKVKSYCRSLSPYTDTCDYCNNEALCYTIEIEQGQYVATLKIEVYVDPKTDKVICAEIFKANGGSSSESFSELANSVSEVLCGRKITKLERYVTEVDESGGNNITYIEYKDYRLKLTEGTGSYTTGDMKKLKICCLEAVY